MNVFNLNLNVAMESNPIPPLRLNLNVAMESNPIPPLRQVTYLEGEVQYIKMFSQKSIAQILLLAFLV